MYSAQVSPDGTILATASYDRDLITWDLATLKPLQTFRGHNDALYALSFSPNGKFIATASGDRTVKLWDVATGHRLDTFSQPAKDQSTVAFSPERTSWSRRAVLIVEFANLGDQRDGSRGDQPDPDYARFAL